MARSFFSEVWTPLKVDFRTPIERQCAKLAEDKLLHPDLWSGFNSEVYISRHPGENERLVLLRELRFNRVFHNGQQMLRAIARYKGAEAADAYMLAAWLRYKPRAGLNYCLAALGDYVVSAGRSYGLHVQAVEGGQRMLFHCLDEHLHVTDWVYLVSCEFSPEAREQIRVWGY